MSTPVLITGCSSGIGLTTARMLAERGVTVYATVRSQQDADRLADIDGVEPFLCDVTVDEQVEQLRSDVEARGQGLYGLVHNAGISHLGPLRTTPLDDVRKVFEVNLFAVHRVTNAFVDLLVASQGRIVTVSSIFGTLATELGGVYSMTKHALEAYTDSLAAELTHQGVHVCAIAPGNFASAIAQNVIDRFAAPVGVSESIAALWAPGADVSRSEYPTPQPVGEACFAALFDASPLERYLVVPNGREADATLKKAARAWAVLNLSSAHRWSRERLLEALDEIEQAIGEVAPPAG